MGWREEVVTALRSWLEMEGGGAEGPTWRRIGSAVRGGQPGMFEVDVRGSMLSADQLQAESLRLAESDREKVDDGHPVMEVSHDGARLRVRVAEFADLGDPTLWLYQQPATFLIDSLIKGISGITDERLAGVLARGELRGELAGTGLPSDLLLPSQDLAYRACRGSGLWMVWGPPGTGKTSVLTRAIVDMIADGKRVLLVSATNIAVDNVLVKVAPQIATEPGVVVRVGTPHLSEVADNADICLPLMVRQRLDDLDRRRNSVGAELATIGKRTGRLNELTTALTGFDVVKFARAERRLADPALTIEALSDQRTTAIVKRDDVEAACTRAASRVAETEQHYRDCAEDRERWSAIDALMFELRTIEAEATKWEAEVQLCIRAVADAERILDDLDRRPRWERITEPGRKRQARAERDLLKARWAATVRDRDVAIPVLQRRIHDLQEDIARRRRQITLERADIARITEERRTAAAEYRDRRDELERYEAEIARLDNELERTKEAVEEVRSARRKQLPLLHAEAEALRASGADDHIREPTLRKQYQQLQEQYEALARDAQGEIIRGARLVAITLAKFRTTPTAMAGTYDVVLVDEVGTASLPEVLLAVAAAQHTAVLLGDFLQLGPVVPQVLKGSRRPDVQRWLLTEVFAHCGIDSPRSAQAHPGCVCLDVQHRFGLDVMHLANSIAYDGILRAGPTIRHRAQTVEAGDAEIVLVDTDGLSDLAQIYRTGRAKGWWPAGILLSRAIAELHQQENSTVGVVTPYALQAEATLEGMRQIESGDTMLAEVGTAHRFQGREFDIVIFDLVESADCPGMWMAKASRTPDANEFMRSGLRLFNVAITRVRHRIYVLGSRRQVEAAATHTALGALHTMLVAKRVRTLAATELVAPLASTKPLGPVGSRVAEILAKHVQVSDIQDEVQFYKTFADRLRQAQNSIWLWAPWVANRLRSLLPVLDEAARRGVRIVVFIRDPTDELQQRSQDLIDELSAVVDTVVCVNVMHQKIVVIDEQMVIIGSLNPLSQSNTREIMVTMHGTHFAKKILDGQHAEIFARPPTCAGCGLREVDLKRRKDETWYWRCRNRTCPARKGNRAWTQNIDLNAVPRGSNRGVVRR